MLDPNRLETAAHKITHLENRLHLLLQSPPQIFDEEDIAEVDKLYQINRCYAEWLNRIVQQSLRSNIIDDPMTNEILVLLELFLKEAEEILPAN